MMTVAALDVRESESMLTVYANVSCGVPYASAFATYLANVPLSTWPAVVTGVAEEASALLVTS